MKRLFLFLLSFVLFVIPVHAQETFSDVTVEHPNHEAIMLLYDFVFVDGNPDGSFAPDRYINRAEFVKILMSMDGEELPVPTEQCFVDVAVDAWYAPYVCYAKDEGYVEGAGGEGIFFNPDQTLNAAEILVLLSRFYGWETGEGEAWYDSSMTFADEANVLLEGVTADTPLTRADFSEMLARTETLWWLEKDRFEESKDFAAYYAEDVDLRITAADCYENETWNEETQQCEIQCTLGLFCDSPDEELAKVADDYYGEDAKEYTHGEVEFASVALYTILGKNIEYASGDVAEKDKHTKMWNYFLGLVPERFLKEFVEYEIASDGKEGTYGAVRQSDNDYRLWVLQMDPADAFLEDGSFNHSELSYTLVHELAHVLALRSSQITLDKKMFELMWGEQDDYDAHLVAAKAACPTYYPGEGCAKAHAYIYAFYTKFWQDIYGEYEKALERDGDASTALYASYPERFVTDYAATNPEEDFAESFTAFVLQEKPTSEDDMKTAKINFMWEYEEFVKLRSYMRPRLVK